MSLLSFLFFFVLSDSSFLVDHKIFGCSNFFTALHQFNFLFLVIFCLTLFSLHSIGVICNALKTTSFLCLTIFSKQFQVRKLPLCRCAAAHVTPRLHGITVAPLPLNHLQDRSTPLVVPLPPLLPMLILLAAPLPSGRTAACEYCP